MLKTSFQCFQSAFPYAEDLPPYADKECGVLLANRVCRFALKRQNAIQKGFNALFHRLASSSLYVPPVAVVPLVAAAVEAAAA